MSSNPKCTTSGRLSWADRMQRDLMTEVGVRDLILARVVSGGEWTEAERTMQAILRILDHERMQVIRMGGIATCWRAAARAKRAHPISGEDSQVIEPLTPPKPKSKRGRAGR